MLLALQRVEQLAGALEIGAQLDIGKQIGAAAHDQRAMAVLRVARPLREAHIDQVGGDLVQAQAVLRHRVGELGFCFRERATAQFGGEEIAGFLHGRRRDPKGRGEQPVLDLAILVDEDHQGLRRADRKDLDMFEGRVAGRGNDQAGPARQLREHVGGRREHVVNAVAARRDLAVNVAALICRQRPGLHQRVDEQPQAQMGRRAPGRAMRGVHQPERHQIGHGVADRGGRQWNPALGQSAAADRLTGCKIGLDDFPKNVAGARVQLLRRHKTGGKRHGL